ncbi:HAMP domain-containing sensor histidine kinase [Flavicella sp.]|uniref:sensor histidine kinase n=1 Tax=Flavicella sp. TaxID=2957742 RepID=UPI0026345D78|nr:HAMP domain-containing sensor histidine kinase [Flavicella sp.]MDG1805894.1 HAMP domain-containing sensor histidine kinase [Flavicella sp.]
MIKKYYKYIIVIVSFGIVSAILWNTYDFSKKFKTNERSKMEILAKAYDRFGSDDLDQDFSLEAKIIESNHNIPMIVTNELDSIIMNRNLDSIKILDKQYLYDQLRVMKKENTPIVINYLENKKYHIYYRDSDLLTRLQYYPLLLVLILLLFSGIIYLVFKSNKIAEQNKLWTGMAKETAHQIGTPLSSLMGWVELMRLDNSVPLIVPEIEKDVLRLSVIADRFSKIGSIPEKEPLDVLPILEKTLAYFKSRSSKNISFAFETQESEVIVNINEQLFTWVLENLIKNAIDAMAGKGALAICLKRESNKMVITAQDTGKGIAKNQFKKIFTPGFTTKKRGWGLGLSLSKRIVEDYHAGRIFVKKSETNVGTTFEVQIPL